MVDLSIPDNSELDRGRPIFIEALWHWIGAPIVRSTMLPFSRLKVTVLRCFGARIGKGAYLKPGIRVKFPWALEIGDHCWIGESVWIDNLAPVLIGSHVCISQGAYLCTGNHDWSSHNMKLFRRPILIGDQSWVGAMTTVCPGVEVGEGAVLTAGSIAARSLEPWTIHAGNPAIAVKARRIRTAEKEIYAHTC